MSEYSFWVLVATIALIFVYAVLVVIHCAWEWTNNSVRFQNGKRYRVYGCLYQPRMRVIGDCKVMQADFTLYFWWHKEEGDDK
jgi:hypothetical protein